MGNWGYNPPIGETNLGGGNSMIFYVHSFFWGNDPIWLIFFRSHFVSSRRFGSDLAGSGRSDGIFGIFAPRRTSLLCGFGGPARSLDPKGPQVARVSIAFICTYYGWKMCKRLSWYAKCLWWNGVPCIKRDPRGIERICGIILQPQVPSPVPQHKVLVVRCS